MITQFMIKMNYGKELTIIIRGSVELHNLENIGKVIWIEKVNRECHGMI
jgi:hypothetical protein